MRLHFSMNTRRTFLAVAAGLVAASAAALLAADSFAQSPAEVKVWIAFTDNRLDWAREKAAESTNNFLNTKLRSKATATTKKFSKPPTWPFNKMLLLRWCNGLRWAPSGHGFWLLQVHCRGSGQSHRSERDPSEFRRFYRAGGELLHPGWQIYLHALEQLQPHSLLQHGHLEEGWDRKPPATWQELEAACQKIMALPDAPQGCVTWPNHGWFYEQWMAQQNALLANNDNGRAARATQVFLDLGAVNCHRHLVERDV
jgi:sn-glycerol 3-phosphate transport system substrate-binding protein